MSKITIKKSDVNRVLLSDTMPYEIPFHISNHRFYLFSLNNSNKGIINKFNDESKYTIPLNFRIPKGDSFRVVSIFHPFSQIKVVDFYQKYGSFIASACSRSSISLRAPSKVASCFFDKRNSDDREIKPVTSPEAATLESDFTDDVARTYFAYKDFSMLYQFYSSYIFRRLEKRFSYCVRIDISKCFHSIYTHSVCWAVSGKEVSKNSVGHHNFENEFDGLMQCINFKETNGILVGPEVSRVFSEVILQDVDVRLTEKMTEDGYVLGRDYNLKRYIDDFFIFSNSIDVSEKVELYLSEILNFFKMYLNESKRIVSRRPFMSQISVAKIDIKRAISGYFKSERFSDCLQTNKIMNDIKSSIVKTDVDFLQISNFTISQIHKNIKSKIKEIENKEIVISSEELIKFSERMVDLIGSVLCFGGTFRCLAIGVEILLEIKNLIIGYFPTRRVQRSLAYFEKLAFDELNIVLSVYEKNKNSYHELVSCLIAMKSLCGGNCLNEDRLRNLLSSNKDQNIEGMSAGVHARFTTGIIMSVQKDGKVDSRYGEIYKEVVDEASKCIEDGCGNLKDTEVFMLICDFMSCPFIELTHRFSLYRKVASKWGSQRSNKLSEAFKGHWVFRNKDDFSVKVMDPSVWPQFVNWSVERSLHSVIRKKELPLSY